uniref:Uncharacterized protein n=1 Tax=Arundo donax TaxID=35708 RepID=A0A0A9GUE6_ARUDO
MYADLSYCAPSSKVVQCRSFVR